MPRRHIAGVILAAFLGLSLVSIPSTQAAISTSSYTYVIEGEETPIGLDPISLKDGLLIPQAMLDQVGVQVIELGAGTLSISRGDQAVKLKLGTKTITHSEETIFLATAPIKVMGHLYVPSDALSLLGVQTTSEAGVLYVDVWPLARPSVLDSAGFVAAKGRAAQEHTVNPTKDTYLRVEVVRLTSDLVSSPLWTANSLIRGRAQELLPTSTLLQVTITNSTNRIVSFPANSYFLVDNLGNQYTLSGERLALRGDLFGNLAPGAVASAVLVYPTLDKDANALSFYLQTSVELETIGLYNW